MKAEIREDGNLHITAETVTEAYALKYIYPLGEEHVCPTCHIMKPRVSIALDCTILDFHKKAGLPEESP